MKQFSHILSFLAVTLFVLAAGSIANATGVDPSIIVLNGGDQVPIPGTTFSFFTTTGSDCNFTSPTTATNCNFQNTNPGAATWTALDIDISQVIDMSLVTCGGGAFFASCVVTNDADGTIDISLSGGPGITTADFPFFSIAGWASGTTFDGTITLSSVPEPGTLALLLSGGGLLLARRKRQNVSRA
jgi:hypothetical protein